MPAARRQRSVHEARDAAPAGSVKALDAALERIRRDIARLDGDPLAQARAVTVVLEVLRDMHGTVADLRLGPVGQLRQQGRTWLSIAEELGISPNAVVQIDRERLGLPRTRPRAERPPGSTGGGQATCSRP